MGHNLERQQLHQGITQILRREIRSQHHVGEKLDSERLLAERFGVSMITVRAALVCLVQEGFIERRHGSGTYVADWQAQQHIAIMTEADLTHPLASQFFLRVVHRLERYFKDRNFSTRIYMGTRKPWQDSAGSGLACPGLLQSIKAGQVRGVIAAGAYPAPSWIRPLNKQGVPIVGLGDHFDNAVKFEWNKMVHAAVDQLVKSGCRKIALLEWKPSGANDVFLLAFKDALKSHGLRVRQEWVRNEIHPSKTGAGWEEFREIWTAKKEKPDGLVVCDDVLFRDVITAILELGIKVPEQLKIVTQSNRGLNTFFCPFPITRLEYNPQDFVETAGELMVQLLSGNKPEACQIVVPYVRIPEPAPLPSIR